jgi:hypothetical protein
MSGTFDANFSMTEGSFAHCMMCSALSINVSFKKNPHRLCSSKAWKVGLACDVKKIFEFLDYLLNYNRE